MAGQAKRGRRQQSRLRRTIRGPVRRRGRPPATLESRLLDLCENYAKLRADTSGTLTSAQEEARPASRFRYWKAVTRAQKAGLLDVPGSWWCEEAVQAARVRAAFCSVFQAAGRPRTGTQVKRDDRATQAILAALPGNTKWYGLHHDLAGREAIPKSWTGFLKLRDRLNLLGWDKETSLPEKMSPRELACELGLVSEDDAAVVPRPLELELALERLRLSRPRRGQRCRACRGRLNNRTVATVRLGTVGRRTREGVGVTLRICHRCLRNPARIPQSLRVAGFGGAMVLQSSVRIRQR
jgi:hypothetical protein